MLHLLRKRPRRAASRKAPVIGERQPDGVVTMNGGLVCHFWLPDSLPRKSV